MTRLEQVIEVPLRPRNDRRVVAYQLGNPCRRIERTSVELVMRDRPARHPRRRAGDDTRQRNGCREVRDRRIDFGVGVYLYDPIEVPFDLGDSLPCFGTDPWEICPP